MDFSIHWTLLFALTFLVPALCAQLVQLAGKSGDDPASGRLEARVSPTDPFRAVCSSTPSLPATGIIPIAACKDLGYRNVSAVRLGDSKWKPQVQDDWIQFTPSQCPAANIINSLWECGFIFSQTISCSIHRRWIWLECKDKIEPDPLPITCSSLLTETKVIPKGQKITLVLSAELEQKCSLRVQAQDPRTVLLIDSSGWKSPSSENCSSVPNVKVKRCNNDSLFPVMEERVICNNDTVLAFDGRNSYLQLDLVMPITAETNFVRSVLTISAVSRLSCDNTLVNVTVPESDFREAGNSGYSAFIGPQKECSLNKSFSDSNVLAESFLISECGWIYNSSIDGGTFGYQNLLTVILISPYGEPGDFVEAVNHRIISLECHFSDWTITSSNFTLL